MRDVHHAVWLFAITFLIYLGSSVGVLEFGDDWSMLQVTHSIVQRGALDVPAGTPGAAPGPDGRHYSKYGLGQSILAIPFYVIGAALSPLTEITDVDGDRISQFSSVTYVVPILGMIATALTVALFFLTARLMGFSTFASSVAALGLGLGTFAWYWALTFMSEPASMLLMVIAFYAHLRDYNRPSPGWLAVAGGALAFSLLLRVASVIVLPGFGLWLLWQVPRTAGTLRDAARRIAAWSMPVTAGLISVAIYNAARFGSIWDIGYGSTSEHLQGRMWVGVYGVIFSPGRSMFVNAPILLAAALGWVWLWRTRRHFAIAIALIVVPYVLFHSRLPYWDGSGCWSPRYITTILPLLMVGLASVIDRGLKPAGWVALTSLGIVSVVVQTLGILVPCIPYASRMLVTEASAERLLWHPAYSPIVEHARSLMARDLPLHLAPVFFRSSALGWFQATAFMSGLVLLLIYIRRGIHTLHETQGGALQNARHDRARIETMRVSTRSVVCQQLNHRELWHTAARLTRRYRL